MSSPKPRPTSQKGEFQYTPEGYLYPIQRRVSAEGEITFNVELNSAPAPSRKFVADGFWIVESTSCFKLYFGQLKKDGALRALLELNMPSDSVHNFGKGVDSTSYEFGYEDTLSGLEEPEQTLALSATFIRGGLNAHVGCIDFYYTSPFASFQPGATSTSVAIEPIVRVQVSRPVYQGTLIKLANHAKAGGAN